MVVSAHLIMCALSNYVTGGILEVWHLETLDILWTLVFEISRHIKVTRNLIEPVLLFSGQTTMDF